MAVVYTVWGSEDGLLAVVSSVERSLKVARDYLGAAPGTLYSGKTRMTLDLLKAMFRNEHMVGVILHRKEATGIAEAHVKITVVETNTLRDGERV